MPRHSKNNTAGSFFTAHEKEQLKGSYGTQRKRLGKDSFRNFDCCSLCLKTFVEPQTCQKGHLFCKECIFENLLAQRKNIKKQKKLYSQYLDRVEIKKETKKEEDNAAAIQAFDKLECGVLNTSGQAKEALKPKHSGLSASFWMPSTNDMVDPNAIQVMKKPLGKTMCPEGNHPMKLKHLVSIRFLASLGDTKAFQCPVCNKNFTNSSKAIVLRPCGHAMCNSCFTTIIKDTRSCYTCQVGFTEEDPIDLESGGTGFAGHHGKKLEVSKHTPVATV